MTASYKTVILAALFTICSPLATAAAKPLNFEGAEWIWIQPDPAQAGDNYPAGSVYFRGVLMVPEGAEIKTAEAFVTADNLFTLYVNGQLVGQSAQQPERLEPAEAVRRGAAAQAGPQRRGGRGGQHGPRPGRACS